MLDSNIPPLQNKKSTKSRSSSEASRQRDSGVGDLSARIFETEPLEKYSETAKTKANDDFHVERSETAAFGAIESEEIRKDLNKGDGP